MNVLLVLVRTVGPALMELTNTTASVLLGTLVQTVKVIRSFDFVIYINVMNENGLKKIP